jgi:hypothetical protein
VSLVRATLVVFPSPCFDGQAIAEGRASKSVIKAISEREGELKSITDRLLEPGLGSLVDRLENLRATALQRLANLRKLVSHPQNVEETPAVLAEHFATLNWNRRARSKMTYRANGRG